MDNREPKTINSIRDIPLTNEAIMILKDQQKKLKLLKDIPTKWADMVFLCRDGTPTKKQYI